MEINHSLVPTGFHFKPTDQELIGRFLRNFLVETPRLLPPPPHNTIIHRCNLFGNHSEPSEIWEAFGGGGALQLAAADQPALYFISELTKLNSEGSHMARKMGRSGGKWDCKAVPAWIGKTDGNPTCIGLKRTFCYKNVDSEDHGGWLLDEYSLFATPRKRNTLTSYDFDYVLCRLRKNGVNKRKCPTSSSSEDDQVTTSKKNGTNKRKCPTSSSSEDQVTTSKKKKKAKRANKEIEKDDGQEAGSKQDMNLINVVEEEEGRQGNSCLTTNLVVSEHEMNDFTVGDDVDYGYDDNDPRLTITVAELEEILALEPTDGAVEEEVLLSTASASEELLLGKERQEVPLPVSSTIVVADVAVEDQALNPPNMFEELIPETRELPLPASSGIAEDGTVEEKAWDPSLLEQYWLAETQQEEPLNPSFYRDFMFADGEEAYNPSAFDNVVDQPLFGNSYLNSYSFMEDQFTPLMFT